MRKIIVELKRHAKGFAAGLLVATLLIPGATALANAMTRQITVTSGHVNMVVDGQAVQPTDAAGNIVHPFIYEGTTFVPVRTIAEIAGFTPAWDSNTSTVYLTREGGQPFEAPAADTPIINQPDIQAPEPAPETAGASRIFSGSGDDVLSVPPFDGPYVFTIRHDGDSGNFAVWAAGDRRTLLVNTIGQYQGTTRTTEQDTNMLEISAQGAWVIEQRPLSAMEQVGIGQTITGTGDQVIRLTSHGQTAHITYVGTRNFAVWARGQRSNLLVNVIGDYTGRVAFRDSYTLLEINATGEWSITIE